MGRVMKHKMKEYLLEAILDSSLDMKRELVTLLSAPEHEVARWKEGAYESVDRFNVRAEKFNTWMAEQSRNDSSRAE